MSSLNQLPSDPANRLPSDYHRRVLGHIPVPKETPISGEALYVRMIEDKGSDSATISQTLDALIDSLLKAGWVNETDDGYRQTDTGYEIITAPVLMPREKEEDGEFVTQLVEDPPLKGKPLKRAKEINEEFEEANAEALQANKDRREKILKKELIALKEEE
jgi:hypothetical protein